MPVESFEELVARINRNAFVPTPEPTGATVMPKQVKLRKGQEFTFAASKGGAQSKYDWDSWLNGDLLLLERSSGTEDDTGTIVTVTEKRDFEVPTNSMPGKLKMAARKRYKVVQVSKKDADGKPLENGGLIIKARDMTPEERVEEDKQRAEEKEALSVKRAEKKAAADAARAASTAA